MIKPLSREKLDRVAKALKKPDFREFPFGHFGNSELPFVVDLGTTGEMRYVVFVSHTMRQSADSRMFLIATVAEGTDLNILTFDAKTGQQKDPYSWFHLYGSGSQPATPEPTVTLNRGKKGGFGACSYETYFGLNPSGQGVAFSGGLQLV